MGLKFLNWSTLKTNHQNILLVLTLFLIFIFLRIWLLPSTIPFNWDQERDAFVVEKIISRLDIPLIGPRVVGDNGFYLGPYFFYLLTPFYFLTSLHPFALVYFLLFYLILFFFLTFFVLKILFSFRIALIFLLLWSVLPATISQDRVVWNPFLIPLAFTFLLFLLSKFQNNSRNYFIFGLFLGLTFHIHFQGIFYLIFVLIYIYRKYPQSSFKSLWLFLGFGLTFIPLIIFDFRHEWLNSHLFLNFFLNQKTAISSPFNFLSVWSNFIGELTGIYNIYYSIIIWIITVIFGYRHRRQPIIFSGTCLILITPLAFALYGHRPSEYYFIYLLPIFILFFSIFISQFNAPRYLIFSLILLLSVYSFLLLQKNPTSLFYKDDIVKTAKFSLKEQKVFITYQTPLGENSGFDYLIQYYKINRTSDSNYPAAQFLIPKNIYLPSSGNISFQNFN